MNKFRSFNRLGVHCRINEQVHRGTHVARGFDVKLCSNDFVSVYSD